MKISRKVALVYLLTLAPLVMLGLGLLFEWYNAHLTVVENDRLNNARLVATAFETFTRDVAGASRALGEATLADPPSSKTPSRFTLMTNSFPLHFSAVVDQDGRVVYANDEALIGEQLDDPAIDAARTGTGFAIGKSRRFGEDVGFMLAQPLVSPRGQETGVAVQFVDPERLARRLSRSPNSGGGTFVVDSGGTLVTMFERPELGKQQLFWGDTPAVRGALGGRETVDRSWRSPLDNQRVVSAAVPIGRTGWAASSTAQYDAALSPYRRSLTIAVGLGFLLLIVSGTAAGLMARSLITSIGALRNQSLAVGDRTREAADIVRSGDEIEDVSRVLQQTDIELRSFIDGLEAMGAAGRTLSAAVGEGDVENAIVRSARELFDAEAIWVFLYNERKDMLETEVWWSIIGAPAPALAIRPGHSVAGRVFNTGRIAVVEDVEKDPDFAWHDVARQHGIRSLVEIPLERGGRPFGVLGIFAAGVERWQLAGREMGLLRAFGTEIATVLENARLYENERFIADTLQQSLLTLPDRVPGVTFACSYHASTQAGRVGGDFYDLFEIDDRVGIVMGDVAGHGLDAAVLTSLVKNAVRAHADEPGKTPAEVVELTNELVVKESRPESFVTLFVGALDCEAATLTYCNAGHTTGVVLRADGSVIPLASTSMLVGAFSGVRFEQSVTPVAQHDTILLYTDGLTEARKGRELYGERRLFAFLGGLVDRDPHAVVDAVLAEVMEYTSGELSDDLALLAVQRS